MSCNKSSLAKAVLIPLVFWSVIYFVSPILGRAYQHAFPRNQSEYKKIAKKNFSNTIGIANMPNQKDEFLIVDSDYATYFVKIGGSLFLSVKEVSPLRCLGSAVKSKEIELLKEKFPKATTMSKLPNKKGGYLVIGSNDSVYYAIVQQSPEEFFLIEKKSILFEKTDINK